MKNAVAIVDVGSTSITTLVGEHGVNCLVNVPVELEIELVRAQFLHNLGDAAGVNQHGADDRLLRRGGVGYFAFK